MPSSSCLFLGLSSVLLFSVFFSSRLCSALCCIIVVFVVRYVFLLAGLDAGFRCCTPRLYSSLSISINRRAPDLLKKKERVVVAPGCQWSRAAGAARAEEGSSSGFVTVEFWPRGYASF
jgi:hypothetical protein